MSNNQFKAVPSTDSNNTKNVSKNGEAKSNSSISNANNEEYSVEEYEDGVLEETNGDEEGENYSNLDLSTVKLFVGQIPYSYGEENLYPLFSQFGPIAEIVVIRDRFTFKSRGCAFVSFRNKQDADSCIRELNQRLKLPPLNTPLRVKYAYTEQQLDNVNDLHSVNSNTPNLTTSSSPSDQNTEKSQDLTIASNFLSCLNIDKYEIGVPHPENKLFIRNIPKNVTEDELSTLFETFGEILDVVVLRTTIHTSKGCGFVKFVNQESAEMVINTFKREIMTPIQEYQQATAQQGEEEEEEVNSSHQRLVELTNKLLESSFLMKGAITPLLVRNADNDYVHPHQQQHQQQHSEIHHPIFDTHNGSYYNYPPIMDGHNPRRRKSYPFSYHQHNNGRQHYPRGLGTTYQQQNHYQNPYYDHHHSAAYMNNFHHQSLGGSGSGGGGGGLYAPPQSYYYPTHEGGVGNNNNGVPPSGGGSSGDTVYFYHLYNNPTPSSSVATTTTIGTPSNNNNNGNSNGNATSAEMSKAHQNGVGLVENGPSPVPPMYYYYPPYYYHHPQQYAPTGSNNNMVNANTTANNTNATSSTTNTSNKYQSSNNGLKKQKSERKNQQERVTKCSDA